MFSQGSTETVLVQYIGKICPHNLVHTTTAFGSRGFRARLAVTAGPILGSSLFHRLGVLHVRFITQYVFLASSGDAGGGVSFVFICPAEFDFATELKGYGLTG